MNKYILINLLTLFTIFNSTGQVLEKIVAKVDDEIILKSELEMAHLQFKKSNQVTGVENLECKVLETLIINKLLLAKAVIDSVVVSPEELEQQLDARMNQILTAYGANEATIIEEFGKTIEQLKQEFKADLENQMIIQKMQSKITSGIEVTPSEVEDFFDAIPKDSLPFFSSELEIAQIVKIPEPGSVEKDKVKNQLEDIRKQIINGADFATFAKKYSQDPLSAVKGGELGYFKKTDLVGEFVAAAIVLKPGEISPVIESPFGYHIIELLDVRGNEINTRHILIAPKSGALDILKARKSLDSLRTKIMNDSISFEKAANKYSDDIATKTNGGFIADETGSIRVAANRTELIGPDLFFLVNKMKEGEISQVVEMTTRDKKKALRIVYLQKSIRAHEANLRDDYHKIYNAALTKKKNEALDKWFNSTKDEVYIHVDEDYSHCEILVN